MELDLENLVKAFQKWEDNYRADPDEFLSPYQIAELEVSQVSVDRAEYFMALLKGE